MAGNSVTLTFAGDSKALERSMAGIGTASKQMADQVGGSNKRMAEETGGAHKKLGAALDKTSFATGVIVGAFADLGDAMQGINDLTHLGATRAQRLARAQADVSQAYEDVAQAAEDAKQATEDYQQAQLDGKQAALDAQQAQLDLRTATDEYNKAVREHGKGSAEAAQAAIDMQQAQLDLDQATRDGSQAQLDASQALRDQSQAAIDAKSASLDLVDAQKEAKPPGALAQTAEVLGSISPLILAAVAAMQLLNAEMLINAVRTGAVAVAQGVVRVATIAWTAVQWLLNVALDANPIGLIVLAVAALVGAIVWIATKTTWFQDIWRVAWSWIKDTASSAWDFIKKIPGWIKDAFLKIGGYVFEPFRWAFNKVADVWNGTIGRLHWTVPDWVWGIGGKTISVPQLPHFHQGGVVPGVPGQEVLAVLQAGERVQTAAQAASADGGGSVVRFEFAGSLGALLEREMREGRLRISKRYVTA